MNAAPWFLKNLNSPNLGIALLNLITTLFLILSAFTLMLGRKNRVIHDK